LFPCIKLKLLTLFCLGFDIPFLSSIEMIAAPIKDGRSVAPLSNQEKLSENCFAAFV